MAKHTFSLAASAVLVASLGAQEITLDPIVVSASKTEQSLRNITANVDILSSDELEEQHVTTVAEALEALGGITLTQSGGVGTLQSLFMRGMDTNRILVLIDGVRYQDPSNTSGASFAHLLVSNIEQIEVIKGAQSGVWGADASAGVINIITKTPEKGTRAGIHLEKGGFNTKKWGGYLSHGAETYDFKLNIDRLMSDSFTAQSPRGSDIDAYEEDPYSNTTLRLSARLRPTSSDTFVLRFDDINALSSYDDYGNPDALQRSDVRTRLYGLSYTKLCKTHTLSLKANRSAFTRDELDTAYGVKVFEGSSEQLEASDRIDYRGGDFFLFGASHERFEADYLRADGTGGGREVNSEAVFATNTNTFGPLVLTQSLRHDDYSNFSGKTTGKIGAKYAFQNGFSAGANYGSAYTAPNLIRILNPWGSPNPDLDPENTRSLDLSVGYRDVLLTYFDSRVDNLIEWNDGRYENLPGKSLFRGYEFSYRAVFQDALSFRAAYTHLSRFEDKNGRELARRPKREAKGGIDYYGVENLHVGLDARYVGTRYDRTGGTGGQTGRYTLFDLVVNYDLTPSVTLYGKIDNLTDQYYQSVEGYTASPRTLYVGMKADF